MEHPLGSLTFTLAKLPIAPKRVVIEHPTFNSDGSKFLPAGLSREDNMHDNYLYQCILQTCVLQVATINVNVCTHMG